MTSGQEMTGVLVRAYFSPRRRFSWGSQREGTRKKTPKKVNSGFSKKTLFFVKGFNSVTVDEIARYS